MESRARQLRPADAERDGLQPAAGVRAVLPAHRPARLGDAARHRLPHHQAGGVLALVSRTSAVLAALHPDDVDHLQRPCEVKRRIEGPGGKLAFVVAEVRRRKRYLNNWMIARPVPQRRRARRRPRSRRSDGSEPGKLPRPRRPSRGSGSWRRRRSRRSTSNRDFIGADRAQSGQSGARVRLRRARRCGSPTRARRRARAERLPQRHACACGSTAGR